MERTAKTASPPCAARAAGMNWPGNMAVLAIGFHNIKPVITITAVLVITKTPFLIPIRSLWIP
jgi:hypothetical protein